MLFRKLYFPIMLGLGILIFFGFLFLLPASEASAQCGSQASSCKNCHETEAVMPVNNDGNGWHTSHAFGDFCYACHGGNNQSLVEAEAHTGMVPPLSDIKIACQGCHPNDLAERAQVYADALGVTLGEAGAAGAAGAQPTAAPTGASPSASESTPVPAAPAASIDSGSSSGSGSTSGTGVVVDYNQRYAETVEGKLNINWGNVILVVLIVLTAVGGGTFVYANERKRRGLPFVNRAPKAAAPAALPVIEGYSPEVAALLPLLARLNPMGLHSLKRILQNPEQANDLLHSLAQLDPDLVKRMRNLDRDSRELLLAIAGD